MSDAVRIIGGVIPLVDTPCESIIISRSQLCVYRRRLRVRPAMRHTADGCERWEFLRRDSVFAGTIE